MIKDFIKTYIKYINKFIFSQQYEYQTFKRNQLSFMLFPKFAIIYKWHLGEWIHVCIWLSPVAVLLECHLNANRLCSQFLSRVHLFETPWTGAHQAPLSMGILQARIMEWVAMPSSGGSSNPGIEPMSSTLQADFLPSEGSPVNCLYPNTKCFWY